MSKEIFKKFSGKYYGMYRGKILDNNDPSQLGRCRIQIYPMFSEISVAADLPWATPAMSLFEGAGTGIGSFCVPDIDTFVFCFFEEGDIYQPVYFAEAQTAGKGLPTERTTNYPNRKVFKTSSGIVIYIDDTAKVVKIKTAQDIYFQLDDTNKTIDIKHPVTARIFIDATGNVIVTGTTVSINPL